MFSFGTKTKMVDPAVALPGRPEAIPTAERSLINNQPLKPPYPEGSEIAEFALGCFWGEEKMYWEQPGVIVTAVGYEGGLTPNPTYEEVSSGKTGHAETVRVVFDPKRISDAQARLAEASRDMYQAELTKAGYGKIMTEIVPAPEFYFAEDYHQQYLVRVPNGYCPIHATGVKLEGPIVTMEQV